MRAARYYSPGNVTIEDIPEPLPGEGQVKVKIAWNGICGSDLHSYQSRMVKVEGDEGSISPVTMGHEFSGTIVGHGSGVDQKLWKLGQNVIIEPVLSCLKESCVSCVAGTRNICPEVKFIGVNGFGGGLAEFIVVDTRNVHILPEGISLETGAMIEPLAVAWYAVKKSGYRQGQTALIVGAGPIGLLILKVLRSIDPSSTVIVSEVAEGRLSLASKLGATATLNPLAVPSPSPSSNAKIVLDTLGPGGGGVDVAFEVTGNQAGLDTALLCVRPRGTLTIVALWEETPKLNLNLVMMREINIIGSAAYTGIHPEVLDAVASGRITNLDDLITKKIVLEDLVEGGIMPLLNEKETQVKILVHP